MQFTNLAIALAAFTSLVAASPNPLAPAAERTKCTTYVTTVTTTRDRPDATVTSTSTILYLQPTTTYITATSYSTYLATEDRGGRTRTETQTVSECINW